MFYSFSNYFPLCALPPLPLPTSIVNPYITFYVAANLENFLWYICALSFIWRVSSWWFRITQGSFGYHFCFTPSWHCVFLYLNTGVRQSVTAELLKKRTWVTPNLSFNVTTQSYFLFVIKIAKQSRTCKFEYFYLINANFSSLIFFFQFEYL